MEDDHTFYKIVCCGGDIYFGQDKQQAMKVLETYQGDALHSDTKLMVGQFGWKEV